MTAVAIEIALPVEAQNVAGVVECREKLAQAATELGWPAPHTTDTKTRLADGVPTNIALQREKLPVAVALYWAVDDEPEAIHSVVATIVRWFDVEYMTVDGVLVALPVEAPAEAYGAEGCLTAPRAASPTRTLSTS